MQRAVQARGFAVECAAAWVFGMLRSMNCDKLVAQAADFRREAPRLTIRRLCEGDYEVAVAHELDRRIMRHIRDPLPEAEVREKVRGMCEPWSGACNEWVGLVVARRDTDEMIGLVAFRVVSEENATVEIGYRLHPDHQRKGFGYEACRCLLQFLFSEADVRRVVALCVADNEASFRLMEKLGMRREARFHEFCQIGGAWQDELAYAILRREWSRQPAI